MIKINKKVFIRHVEESLGLVEHLLWTKRDEMNSITKEYVDKLLEAVNLNPKDFDVDYEHIWSYVIGFCYARKAAKDTEGKE